MFGGYIAFYGYRQKIICPLPIDIAVRSYGTKHDILAAGYVYSEKQKWKNGLQISGDKVI